MPNMLNELFINVGKDITNSINHIPKLPKEYLTNRKFCLIFLSPVMAFDVIKTTLNLDSSKSIGPSSIPLKLRKILGPKSSYPFAIMINQSFPSHSSCQA